MQKYPTSLRVCQELSVTKKEKGTTPLIFKDLGWLDNLHRLGLLPGRARINAIEGGC